VKSAASAVIPRFTHEQYRGDSPIEPHDAPGGHESIKTHILREGADDTAMNEEQVPPGLEPIDETENPGAKFAV
jgi:hypothetical protein